MKKIAAVMGVLIVSKALHSQGPYVSPFVPATQPKPTMTNQEPIDVAPEVEPPELAYFDVSDKGTIIKPHVVEAKGEVSVAGTEMAFVKRINENDKISLSGKGNIELRIDRVSLKLADEAESTITKVRQFKNHSQIGISLDKGTIRVRPERNTVTHPGFIGKVTIETPFGTITSHNADLIAQIKNNKLMLTTIRGGVLVKHGISETIVMPHESITLPMKNNFNDIASMTPKSVRDLTVAYPLRSELMLHNMKSDDGIRFEKAVVKEGP